MKETTKHKHLGTKQQQHMTNTQLI